MPIYDYVCAHCQAKLAVIRNMAEYDVPPSEEEERDVPVCPADETAAGLPHSWQRVIGPTSFKLEGGGWYAKGGY